MHLLRTTAGRAGAGALALGLVLSACAPGEDDDGQAADTGTDQETVTDDAGDPAHGGTIAVGVEAEAGGWSPWDDSWSTPVWVVARSFYDTLMERDEDGVPTPNLAASVEPNDDHTEVTIVLREGIEFHDDEPLDAEAVAANFEQMRQEGTRTAAQLGPVEEVVVEDELTLRLELDEPNVAFIDVLVHAPGVMVSPASIEAETVSTEPVGTGPFVFESWQRDSQLEVSRNEDYWREDLPYLDGITFRPLPDEDSRTQSLLAGDIDAMQTLNAATIEQMTDRSEEFNLYLASGNSATSVILNNDEPPFDDHRIREAFAYAVDRDESIAVSGGPDLVPPAHGLFNPDSPWYVDEIADAWPSQDLDRAQQALDDYSQDPDRSDGQEAGAPVSFQFDTPPDPTLLELASVIQAQVGQVGLEMSINGVEQAVHIQEAVAGEYQAKAWRMGDEEDPDWMVSGFSPGASGNFTNFENEQFLDHLLEARRTPDEDDRRELYHEAQLILAEEIPFVTTGHTVNLIAATPELFGFDDWQLPDGEPGIGHPESMARWHSVWLDRE